MGRRYSIGEVGTRKCPLTHGPDGIPNAVLKECSELLATPLTNIFRALIKLSSNTFVSSATINKTTGIHSFPWQNLLTTTVRGHFRVPTSPTEYLHPKTVNTFHLSDTPYIPPHRRWLYNPYSNSSPSQSPSVS